MSGFLLRATSMEVHAAFDKKAFVTYMRKTFGLEVSNAYYSENSGVYKAWGALSEWRDSVRKVQAVLGEPTTYSNGAEKDFTWDLEKTPGRYRTLKISVSMGSVYEEGSPKLKRVQEVLVYLEDHPLTNKRIRPPRRDDKGPKISLPKMRTFPGFGKI